MSRRVIVTGGCGFIGSYVCKELVRQEFGVSIIDNLYTGNLKNIEDIKGDIEFYQEDIRDLEKIDSIFKKADYVIHLAANVSVQKSIEDPHFSRSVNIDGFLNILELCKKHKIKKLIYASSAAVYGAAANLPLTEAEICKPISNYGLEKLINEQYAELYKDISSIGLRFFNVFGKGQDPKSQYSGVITKFITAFKEGREINIFGDGLQSRDFIYVEDVAQAVIKSLNSEFTGILNVCTEKSTNLLELIEALEKITGKAIKKNFLPVATGDIKRSLGSGLKARKEIGFFARYSLSEGLKNIFQTLTFSKLYAILNDLN